MQKWEYRHVQVSIRDYKPMVAAVDGPMGSIPPDAPIIYDYLKTLGEEGWELVRTYKLHPAIANLIFKRPKQE